MRALNRILMLLVGVVVLVAAGAILLANYGVAFRGTAEAAGSFVSAAEGTLSTSGQLLLGLVGAGVALLGIALVLGEIRALVEPPVPPVRVEEAPGRETLVSSSAVVNLAQASSVKAGAVEPIAHLHVNDHPGYDIELSIEAPDDINLRTLTSEVREQIASEMARQHVPLGRLEVIVRDISHHGPRRLQ